MSIFTLSEIQSAFDNINHLPHSPRKDMARPIIKFNDIDDYWYISTKLTNFEEWLAQENSWKVIYECGVSDCFFLMRDGDGNFCTSGYNC